MRKGILTLLYLMLLLLYGCKSEVSTEVVKEPTKSLTILTNIYGQEVEMIEDMAREYEESHSNIQLQVLSPGGVYENILKIKLSSGDAPDLFSTHGWSIKRYSPFLVNLVDKPWVSNIRQEFRPFIEDKDGHIYVLPFNMDMTGIVYNKDIFEDLQITIKQPDTYEELIFMAEEIIQKSKGEVTPFISAKDTWCEAQFFDYFATPLLVDHPEHNYVEDLYQGNFQWEQWNWLSEEWLDIYKKGYVNEDLLSSNYNDNIQRFANGEAAMAFYGPYFIPDVYEANPNINVSMMAIPAIYEGGNLTLATGERTTLGVYKEGKNVPIALEVLDYYAQPEQVKRICDLAKLPSAFEDINDYKEDYALEDVKLYPYFDREYLPDGMWTVMCNNSQGLIAGDITIEQASLIMKQEYNRLKDIGN